MQSVVAARTALMAGTVFGALALSPGAVRAQDTAARIGSIEAQIKALQNELQQVKRELARSNAEARAAQQDAARGRNEARRAPAPVQPPVQPPVQLGQAAPAKPPGPPAGSPGTPVAVVVPGTAEEQPVTYTGKHGEFRVGGITVQFGGFIEADGIFRARNEVADISSNWNTIPFPVSPEYHETEIRGTARHSRISLLVQGKPDPSQTLTAYGEADFLGAAPTSNSIESNSYTPRLRQAFASYDNSDWNLHVLAGQAWTLLTMNKTGIVPRQENVPLVIDSGYLPGFTWARQPQLRVATDFDDHRIWLAASVENPQTNFYVGPNGAGTIVGTTSTTNPGGSGFASTVNYSFDAGPDVIVKAAYDPGFGHFEAYGIARFFRSRVSNIGQGGNSTVLAGGGGAAMLVPIIPKLLDLQGSFLVGSGIGRYGAGGLPDATLSQSGSPVPLPEIQALAGLIGHPHPDIDVYGYVGTEQIQQKSFSANGKGYGYGSPLYSNAGCEIELSTLGCVANTSGLVQGTLGGFWRFLHGSFGVMQVGAQYSYTRRSIFSGMGGGGNTDENIVLVNFKYSPFQ